MSSRSKVLFFLLQESKFFKFLGFMWNPLSWVMEAAAIMAIALANGGVSNFFRPSFTCFHLFKVVTLLLKLSYFSSGEASWLARLCWYHNSACDKLHHQFHWGEQRWECCCCSHGTSCSQSKGWFDLLVLLLVFNHSVFKHVLSQPLWRYWEMEGGVSRMLQSLFLETLSASSLGTLYLLMLAFSRVTLLRLIRFELDDTLHLMVHKHSVTKSFCCFCSLLLLVNLSQ